MTPVGSIFVWRNNMKNKFDVVALGELLIDFTENGMSSQGNPLMEANPGGAPCNVLAMLTNLGHKTSFIGKVGDDMFGNRLEETISEIGIDTSCLFKDKEVHTTLAFVHTGIDGDRDFSFYRNPGADMMLNESEVLSCSHVIENAGIFHFGTLSMTSDICRNATKSAIDIAKKEGALISFDPNLREPLWDSLDTAREQVMYGLSKCDILKISDNEIKWLTNCEDYDEGVQTIREQFNIPLVLVSLGKDGSIGYSNSSKVCVQPFLLDNTIETTGAGDTFCACILHYVLQNGLKDYSEKELTDMLTFAGAAAALITTKKGALRVMPTLPEIEKLICHG